MDTEVIIIGAGLAGLYAASILSEAGIEVLVLEARNRVGGRTFTEIEADYFIDHGGQWISPGQEEIRKLVQSLNIEFFENWDEGETLYWKDNQPIAFNGIFPPGYEQSALMLQEGAKKLEALAQTLPIHAPWEAPLAKEWDSLTLHEWVQTHISDALAGATLVRSLEGVFCGNIEESSLLSALAVIRSGAHEITRLTSTSHLGPELRVVGGVQQICQRMASLLGGRIQSNQFVTHVEQDRDRVKVSGQDFSISAQQVIVTLPPALAGRIRYSPALPAARDHLTQRAPMGWVIKTHCLYPSRFWLKKGLSGKVISEEAPIHVTVDNSPPSGVPGILTSFFEGASAYVFAQRSQQARRDTLIEKYTKYLGEEARNLFAYYDYSWGDDEYARGVYGGFFNQRVLTFCGHALRAPIGRIHWAGTESSIYWNGKLEGALASGKNVAEQIKKKRIKEV